MNTAQGWRSANGGATPISDKNFVLHQTTPALVWSVPHNLGKRCSVQVTDENEVQIMGEIRWVNDNECEITFNTLMMGWVFCN